MAEYLGVLEMGFEQSSARFSCEDGKVKKVIRTIRITFATFFTLTNLSTAKTFLTNSYLLPNSRRYALHKGNSHKHRRFESDQIPYFK